MIRHLRFAGILVALAAAAIGGWGATPRPLILGELEIRPAITGGEFELEPGVSATVSVKVDARAERVEFFESPGDPEEPRDEYQIAVADRPAGARGPWIAECHYRAHWGGRGTLSAVAETAGGKRTSRVERRIWSPKRPAAPPADESRIAFIREANVWVMTPDGHDQMRLTHDGSPEESADRLFYLAPCWLSDNTIACLRAAGTAVTPGRTAVRLLDAGGGRRESVALLAGAVALGVAAGSRRYAFLKLGPRHERLDASWTQPIYLGTGWAKPISRYVAALGTKFGTDLNPLVRWSPTERLLAITVGKPDAPKNSLRIYDRYQARFLDTTGYPLGAAWWQEQGLGPPAIKGLAWLPDDSGWVIACPSGTTYWDAEGHTRPMPIGLYLIGRENRSLTKLTAKRAAEVAISPDGKRAAFTVIDPDGDQPPTIWTINLDGTALARLADNASQPAWAQ